MSNIRDICKKYVNRICKDTTCDGHTKKLIREAVEKTVSFVAISQMGDSEFVLDGEVDEYAGEGWQIFPVIEPDHIVDIDYVHGDS